MNLNTRIQFKDLFPSKLSIIIFISYILLFISQGVLVTYSQGEDNHYKYNTILVVLITEAVKLFVSCGLYCKDHTIQELCTGIRKDVSVLKLYLVPALLYCFYNNLAFLNLSTFDPTTYYLLLQLRVVITGISFQVIFKKYLSRWQWLSLALLTVGCLIKQISFDSDKDTQTFHGKNTSGFDFSVSAILILVQTFCSCFAGVYNEYILKGKGCNVNIFIQNVYMYLDSIMCNVVVLLLSGDFSNVLNSSTFFNVLSFKVIIIIINNAAIGIVTSFFLNYLNSILKTFASALELVFTAIVSYILFGIPIYLNTIISIATVSFAVFLYSQNPVVNLKPSSDIDKESEEKLLCDDEECV